MPTIFYNILGAVVVFLKTWWWVIAPIVVYFPARALYYWWIRWEVWYPEQDWIILEIVPPAEIPKPFKSMEDVLSILWPIIDVPNWRERNCQGELLLGGGGWHSFEIASFGGEVHFYIRTDKGFSNTLIPAIYSQFPNAEIFEVDDYTKKVPADIPNEKYGLYLEDFVSDIQSKSGKDYYPIKTYRDFFEEKEGAKKEERVDPINSLLEHMCNYAPDEQVWIQMICNPIVDGANFDWKDEAYEEIRKLAGRPKEGKGKEKSILWLVLGELFFHKNSILMKVIRAIGGKAIEEEEEEPMEAVEEPKVAVEEKVREMKVTPREKEKISAIEQKISKSSFQFWGRIAYIFRKDRSFSYGNYKTGRSYFNHFGSADMNGITFWNKTRPRIHYFFRKRRVYAMKRNLFRKYIRRFPPKYPDMKKGTFVLDIEEVASIFHLPVNAGELPPGVPRVPIRKGAPSDVPTE